MNIHLLLLAGVVLFCVVYADRKVHVIRVSDKAFGKEFDQPKAAPRARRLKGTGGHRNDYDYGVGSHADEYDQEIKHRTNKDLFRDKAGPIDNFDNFNFDDDSDDRESQIKTPSRSSDDFMENARFADIRSGSRSRENRPFH
ncbi:hypothetical protein QR680_001301 [Steinernema hermaphroditum]|uniref:Uncharacterized protein n=1 Tax=Steinernema hermaphroditum TaxID=289476 RepID=A0AA39H0H8_9BILA|nr:hypothetical protein QR680_001301 [Steinernema hermaphroditum]